MQLKDIPLKPKGKRASEFMLEMRELLVGREFVSNSGDRFVVKASGRRQYPVIRRYLNGETHLS